MLFCYHWTRYFCVKWIFLLKIDFFILNTLYIHITCILISMLHEWNACLPEIFPIKKGLLMSTMFQNVWKKNPNTLENFEMKQKKKEELTLDIFEQIGLHAFLVDLGRFIECLEIHSSLLFLWWCFVYECEFETKRQTTYLV